MWIIRHTRLNLAKLDFYRLLFLQCAIILAWYRLYRRNVRTTYLYKKEEGLELLYSQNRESRSVCRIQVDGIGDFVQNNQPVYNPILTVGKGWFPETRFWLRTLTHVNFNRVNKIEAKYKVLRLNVKLREVLLFAYVRPFIHCLYFICERKFYARKNYATVEINEP